MINSINLLTLGNDQELKQLTNVLENNQLIKHFRLATAITSFLKITIKNLRRNSQLVRDPQEDDHDEENRTHDDGGQGQPLWQVEVRLVQVSAVAGVEAFLGVEDEVELGEFDGQSVDYFVVFSEIKQ